MQEREAASHVTHSQEARSGTCSSAHFLLFIQSGNPIKQCHPQLRCLSPSGNQSKTPISAMLRSLSPG